MPLEFYGTNFDDTLDYSIFSADQILHGLRGNDILLYASWGNDTLDGGIDMDTANYSSFFDVEANLSTGQAIAIQEFGYSTDSLVAIENVIGSDGNDTITGDNNYSILTGVLGNDSLDGGAGSDTLIDGNGNDTLNGGTGSDTVVYTGKVTDYAVSFLSTGSVQVIDTVSSNGNDGTDILSGVEQINFADNGVTRIVTGTAANDNLTNDKYWSMMFGGNGNDTLTAAYGNDTLVGGNGNDVLTGGTGADKFVFNSRSEGIDVIKDFNRSQGDKIQILGSSFGATSTNQFSFNASNGALSFSGQQFATLENAGSFVPSLDMTIV